MITEVRPTTFDEVVGQTQVVEYLSLKVRSFQTTGNPVGHMLFLGIPGCGKTTLAHVFANELQKPIVCVSATRLDDWIKVLATLEKLRTNSVLFIDEIHALPRKIQEQMYDVMEDFKADIFVGRGSNKTPVSIDIPRFTMIGATTHAGSLNGPLLRRFGYQARLSPYSKPQLKEMVEKASVRMYDIEIDPEVSSRIASLSLRSASNAYSMLKNYMEIKAVLEDVNPTEVLNKTVRLERRDPEIGLDYASRQYLITLDKADGNAVGVETLAMTIGEQIETVKFTIEPFLLSEIEFYDGFYPFIEKTPRGRVLTKAGKLYVKLCRKLQSRCRWFEDERF